MKMSKIYIENQLDPKWKGHYLGKTKSSYRNYGCKLFSLAYIYSMKCGRQISPDELNQMFIRGGAYYGDLLDDAKCADVMGMKFLGRETNINKPPDWHPTLKEVRFSKLTWSQHFVARGNKNGRNIILDPYGGVERPINYYEKRCGNTLWQKRGFSYRKYKP